MADWSKEYCEKYMVFSGNFSILEEFEKLEEGYSIGFICEGYGFYEIAKINGRCKLVFQDFGDTDRLFYLVDYEDLDDYISSVKWDIDEEEYD